MGAYIPHLLAARLASAALLCVPFWPGLRFLADHGLPGRLELSSSSQAGCRLSGLRVLAALGSSLKQDGAPFGGSALRRSTHNQNICGLRRAQS